jgi:putative IMPACT (imprinted ancient) family translation regulator
MDWGQKTREIFSEKNEIPKFVFLAFNAPHERVQATKYMKKKMRKLHPTLRHG